MWAKWPHRLLHIGFTLICICFLLILLGIIKSENARLVMSLAGTLLVVIGLLTLKFEVVSSDKQQSSDK